MVDEGIIEKILAGAGLSDSTVRAIGAGLYNDSYSVDCERGQFVLRIAPADDIPKLFYEVDMMRSEPGIHKLVAEKTDVPVPRVVHYDFSRKTIDRDFLVMEYLPGNSGLFSERELGGYVRQLHGIESDMCGYPERKAPTRKDWPDLFMEYVQMILDDCLSCGVIEKAERDGMFEVYEENGFAVERIRPVFLHLDLWSQNILTANGKITGMLDFDRGLYGDPELEFAVLDTYGYSSDDFFEGYGEERPCDEKARVRQKLYIVYELIKYAFIRTARGGSIATGRGFVERCALILSSLR